MPQDAFTSRIQTLGEALETHCAELLYARTYPAGFDVLTEREREICALIAARLSNREIAARLFLSEGSVKQYCNRIYSKLNIEGTHAPNAGGWPHGWQIVNLWVIDILINPLYYTRYSGFLYPLSA
ncbi:helix-turn-helix transcriptional regulator [Gemmiger formicilis]|nr:helix-turn-helix transcriptional regulator [Gemmiger formicilis]